MTKRAPANGCSSCCFSVRPMVAEVMYRSWSSSPPKAQDVILPAIPMRNPKHPFTIDGHSIRHSFFVWDGDNSALIAEVAGFDVIIVPGNGISWRIDIVEGLVVRALCHAIGDRHPFDLHRMTKVFFDHIKVSCGCRFREWHAAYPKPACRINFSVIEPVPRQVCFRMVQ